MSKLFSRKPNTPLKHRMIVNFVIGTIVANIILVIVGLGFIRHQIRFMKRKFGADFAPDYQMMAIEMFLIIVLILIILGVLLYTSVYNDIINPVRLLSEATRRISEGDLDFTIEVGDRKDEFGQLCQDFEEMRRRLKDTAQEKIENEEQNRQLISNITHDLKTPVTAIKGYAEGLLDGVAVTPEKQEKYLRTICNKAGELDRLMNELTYYTHIEKSRIPYNFIKINVNNYFKDCVEDISVDLDRYNFKLNYKSDVSPDTLIIADPEQLKKVIRNITGNSVKYCDKSTGRIYIRLLNADDFILIEIADNGKGISPKDLPQIFDRFYRSDVARSSSTGGSGIGLSIVKKIVEDHGGRIWATSTLGEGTTMHIELRKYIELEGNRNE